MSQAKLTIVRSGVDRSKAKPHDQRIDGGNGGGGSMSDQYVTHSEFQDAVSSIKDRFASIDERFAKIETRLDQTATKADLAEMKFDVARWIVGTAIAVSATFITVMTFVLNNAIPKASPQPAQPPIIINVPSQQAAPAPEAPKPPPP